MLFNISQELIDLAEIFYSKSKKHLFIVGGYVRNKILGVPDYKNLDIDLCSALTPKEVKEVLKNKDFTILNEDNTFGVLKIKGKENIYEHATFRTEVYDHAGSHNPTNVSFIEDLETDSIRRDFKFNAIYYDIYNDEIIDPLGGVDDINIRIISTTRSPRIVFNDDSERILRLIRQAVTLGFNIEEETFNRAKLNAFKIKYLPKNRIKNEFERILFANSEYENLPNTKYAHARGILLLAEIGALEYILPELQKIYNLNIYEDLGRDLFNHIIDTFKNVKEDNLDLRLSVLLHDYGKAESLINYKDIIHDKDFLDSIIDKELGENGLQYNKKTISNIKNIIKSLDFKINFLTPNYKIREFIINNYMQINNVFLLKKYILINKYKKFNFAFRRFVRQKSLIEEGFYPSDISKLDISADDIIKNCKDIENYKISEILTELLKICLRNPRINKKEKLIMEVKKILNKNNKIRGVLCL